jgi:hypothetical protein
MMLYRPTGTDLFIFSAALTVEINGQFAASGAAGNGVIFPALERAELNK